MGRRKDKDKERTRDISTPIASPLRSLLIQKAVYTALQALEDRRRYYPAPHIEPARATRRSATQLVPNRPVVRKKDVPQSVQFNTPKSVALCVRRHTRKEVLFAKRYAGRGGRKRFRRAKWNAYSHVRC